MMITVNLQRTMVVDMSSFEEIKNVIAVDLDAGTVSVSQPTYDGVKQVTLNYPAGIRLVRRR